MNNYLVIPANTPPYITHDEQFVKREINGGDLSKYYRIVPREGRKPALKRVRVNRVKEMREVEVLVIALDA